MPVVPSLMVLYTNDAVEVRYSDGSRLQLSPCGASMFHQDAPTDETHPLRGVDTVHKWTQFVTSAHKCKVLQALDFRNRFAQRPLLCSTLMQPEDIVSLYARIDKVAWPKLLKDANAEVLEDGSRRVVSSDEFASVVLSPHGQDLTVCYLSRISEDSSKAKGTDHTEETHSERNLDRHGKGLAVHFYSDCSEDARGSSEQDREVGVCGSEQREEKHHTDAGGENETDDVVASDSVHREEACQVSGQGGESGGELTPEELREASGIIVSDGTISTPSIVHTHRFTNSADSPHQNPPSKCSISPIHHDISSISRVSTPDGLRGMVECDSTLSHGNDTLPAQPRGADVRHSSPVSLANTNTQRTTREDNPDAGGEVSLRSSPLVGAASLGGKVTVGVGSEDILKIPTTGQGDGNNAYSPKSDKACQTLPSNRQTKDHKREPAANSVSSNQGNKLSSERCVEKQSSPGHSKGHRLKSAARVGVGEAAAKSDDCVFSPSATPLPLTCPFQHLHAWQPHHHDDQGAGQGYISEFKQGQLKVIMMEGVVYRFVRLANMKVVEVYPGDGSVFISQGITGLYFLHVAWKAGKLEEKTYSLKALPPSSSKSLYSVEKLIKRAHRFLTGCIENAKLSEREDLPCWKHIPTQVVEPLSTSVLEDCTVPGYGRFTAYTNGRIRIVFDDRTALDMVSDFSSRLQGCLHHSEQEENIVGKLGSLRVSSADQQLGPRRCRLLLPTGKYIILDIDKPGTYRRYINAATEWISWVRSSPKERQQFYQNRSDGLRAQLSAEAELKKIECFNYIVDHSNVPSSGSSQGSPTTTASHPTSSLSQQTAHPSTAHPLHRSPPLAAGVYGRSTVTQSSYLPLSHVPPMSSRQHSSSYGVGYPAQAYILSQGSQSYAPRQPLLSDPKGLEMLQGFNSVREALLRTSQMIKDIDEIVKVRKRSGD
ncbi:hypothetical protein BaRGS_00019462 [Batillaria attramentaria]|uniref:DUF4524 domain-containing protein n=1 Tax=Batillaria attramentaria TaxID=370345 RepID=A0ABD0KQX5_9CAEN